MNDMQPTPDTGADRVVITKVTMLFFLAAILWRTYAHTLPFQLCRPVLMDAKYDLGYILFVLSGLAASFAQNTIAAAILSAALIILPVCIFIYPRKVLFSVLFAVSWIFMAAMQGVYGQHNGYLLFSILLTIPFCARSDKGFALLWEGLRYYGCWVYASTFLLKMLNGAFWQWDYGSVTLSEQTIDQVYWFADSWHTRLVSLLNEYPGLVNIGQKLIFLSEGAFIIGFFTKKYDKLLLFFACCIFLATTLFVMVFFIENLVIYFLIFMRPGQWQALHHKFKILRDRRPAPVA